MRGNRSYLTYAVLFELYLCLMCEGNNNSNNGGADNHFIANICSSKVINYRELNDDVRPIIATLSCRTTKDVGHSLMNRAVFTNATSVASTTNNNCQSVSPILSSFLPLPFSAPPIASLEDLTNGEQNSDITSAKSNIATSLATTFNRNGIREGNLKGCFFFK